MSWNWHASLGSVCVCVWVCMCVVANAVSFFFFFFTHAVLVCHIVRGRGERERVQSKAFFKINFHHFVILQVVTILHTPSTYRKGVRELCPLPPPSRYLRSPSLFHRCGPHPPVAMVSDPFCFITVRAKWRAFISVLESPDHRCGPPRPWPPPLFPFC